MKQLFKKKPVDTSLKIVNVKLSRDLHQKLEAVSDKEKRSLHSQILYLLEKAVEKQ
jgi:hypothetical protein